MKKIIAVGLLSVMAMFGLAGCGNAPERAPADGKNQTAATGTLRFTANGEDFVRRGLEAKDGWRLTFEHVYVSLNNVTAYQADPPFDPDRDAMVKARLKVEDVADKTVDLAEGDENAPPILVAKVADIAAGYYNALSWDMLRAVDGPAAGYSLVLIGQAVKGDRTVKFTIKDENQYGYTGGDYVGDERKGIVTPGGSADLEMTFHLDHLFGDAALPADDGLNRSAAGFEPFALLADGDTVNVDMAAMREKMTALDFASVQSAVAGLGHVGEAHCRVEVKE